MSIKRYKKLVIIVIAVAILAIIFSVYQILMLKKAHSTFDDYYNFRGCTELIIKTDDYGVCRISSGQTIKIVKFDNRWFLDGDLPCGFMCF